MRVAILGAGPAGLYAGYLLKRHGVSEQLTVVEQNPPDATFGFGVVFSDRALEFLSEDDPETHDLIAPNLEIWQDITLNHRGETICIDGVGFAAIGRLRLLQLLQDRAMSMGIQPIYNRAVSDPSAFDDYDLVIAADGANSVVRRAGDFGFSQTLLTNRFIWFGTSQRFETLTQTFKRTSSGFFTAHHYRYSPRMSTFIIEIDERTYYSAGFDRMGGGEARAALQDVFAEELGGHELVTNKSVWRQFPKIRNDRWFDGNKVLVGDALHTAHFSIGSGTRLAMEDVVALVRALSENPRDVRAALASYEATRRPILEKLVTAANASAGWYERFPQHMQLDPWPFSKSYIMRSGRIDQPRLAKMAPRFAAEHLLRDPAT
jgi:2-polyprenyl-6-methoxyphenol hydroxylase-like FAD-dependent oxidoreductase